MRAQIGGSTRFVGSLVAKALSRTRAAAERIRYAAQSRETLESENQQGVV